MYFVQGLSHKNLNRPLKPDRDQHERSSNQNSKDGPKWTSNDELRMTFCGNTNKSTWKDIGMTPKLSFHSVELKKSAKSWALDLLVAMDATT